MFTDGGGAVETRELETLAAIFGALADPSRLRLLYLLLQGECSVGQLAEEAQLSASAASHQLRVLRGLRLVRQRRQGRHVFYRLDDDCVLALISEGLRHVRHH